LNVLCFLDGSYGVVYFGVHRFLAGSHLFSNGHLTLNYLRVYFYDDYQAFERYGDFPSSGFLFDNA
jgi:hypothetical protein